MPGAQAGRNSEKVQFIILKEKRIGLELWSFSLIARMDILELLCVPSCD